MVSVKPALQLEQDKASYFGIESAELAGRNSLSTAIEIAQQPRAWREACAAVETARQQIQTWLIPKLALPRAQVLFCGAGTSAFIGDTLAAWLQKSFARENSIDFRSVSTTDLVADPDQFLLDDRPTIIVSFARSGDSPESVATVELGDTLLSKCFHLIFTCNPDGALANYAKGSSNAYCLLMPEGTNDKGFAMTSSYTSMLVSCASVFTPCNKQLELAAEAAEKVIDTRFSEIAALAESGFDRLVVLGSGALAGTAREAALKCLELAAGHLTVMSDTPLGFRHGPKIVISPKTVVIQLVSSSKYTRKYDDDLLSELRSDDQASRVVELSLPAMFPGTEWEIEDVWLSLIYITYCQILAFLYSYSLGGSVDSPCPSGEVNRVVQGVTIHPYSRSND